MSNLTEAEYTQASIADRMAATLPGQVTWVDLSSVNNCTQCGFFSLDRKGDRNGRCRKTHEQINQTAKGGRLKKAPVFDGKKAQACTLFSRV